MFMRSITVSTAVLPHSVNINSVKSIKNRSIEVYDINGNGVTSEFDNCPLVANPDQIDLDNNGVGLLCQIVEC